MTRPKLTTEDYARGLANGDRAVLAQAITLVESNRAADRIARHLKSFWTPTMIAELEAYAAANPGELDDVLTAALGQLEWEPRA